MSTPAATERSPHRGFLLVAVLVTTCGAIAWWATREPSRSGTTPPAAPAAGGGAPAAAAPEPARSTLPAATLPSAPLPPAHTNASLAVAPLPPTAHPAEVWTMPDGTRLPTLNGVRNPPRMNWPPDRPWAPVIEKRRDAKGQDWYVHADGTLSTVRMNWRSDLGREDATAEVYAPVESAPRARDEPGR